MSGYTIGTCSETPDDRRRRQALDEVQRMASAGYTYRAIAEEMAVEVVQLRHTVERRDDVIWLLRQWVTGGVGTLAPDADESGKRAK